MKWVYIKKNHPLHFVDFNKALNPELYDNLGTTLNDYENNKWVLLSLEQAAFHEEHPDANVEEVFRMELSPDPVRTLEQAKHDKIYQIDEYNCSDIINSFEIIKDGQLVSAWIGPDKRSNYRGSLEDYVLLGITDIEVPVAGMLIPMTVSDARMKLAQIQQYADRCTIVTETHKAAVSALETVEAVDNYDYMTGYPEKLVFEVSE